MSNKTSVEWLEKELIKRGVIRRGFIIPDNLYQQAKEMEKQQIIDAYRKGKVNGIDIVQTDEPNITSEQYYNDTYKGGKNVGLH